MRDVRCQEQCTPPREILESLAAHRTKVLRKFVVKDTQLQQLSEHSYHRELIEYHGSSESIERAQRASGAQRETGALGAHREHIESTERNGSIGSTSSIIRMEAYKEVLML